MPKIFSWIFLLIVLTCTKLWANPPEEPPVDSAGQASPPKEAVAPPPANTPVVIVNGYIVTQQDYDEYLKARMEQTSVKQAPNREIIIEELVNRQLVIQDALKKQLDKTPTFKEKLETQRESLLAALGMQDFLDNHPLSEDMLKAEYDKRVKQVGLPKEYKVKHILVQAEADATAIISALDKAESFAKLAQEKSVDTASAESGGDLGWVSEKQVVSAFATEMVKLKKGEYTKSPVKSEFGWHVITVEDVRDAIPPPFESVKPNLEMMLQTQKMQEYVDDLRKSALVTIPGEDKAVSSSPIPVETGTPSSPTSEPANEPIPIP